VFVGLAHERPQRGNPWRHLVRVVLLGSWREGAERVEDREVDVRELLANPFLVGVKFDPVRVVDAHIGDWDAEHAEPLRDQPRAVLGVEDRDLALQTLDPSDRLACEDASASVRRRLPSPPSTTSAVRNPSAANRSIR